MRTWLKSAALVVGIAILLVVAIGWLLPVAHTATRTRALLAPPDKVFETVSAFAQYPDWRHDVTTIDVSGPPGRGQQVRESGSSGEIPYRVEAFEPPSRLVMRITDGLPFGGTWTYEIEPLDSGSAITITEDGEIYNPVFRFLARFVFGYYATMDGYLDDLERRLAS